MSNPNPTRNFPPFKPGNKIAAGRRDPSFEALRKQAIKKVLQIDDAVAIMEDAIIRGMNGDLAHKEFAFKYSGLTPPTENINTNNTVFAQLGIPVQGLKDDSETE